MDKDRLQEIPDGPYENYAALRQALKDSGEDGITYGELYEMFQGRYFHKGFMDVLLDAMGDERYKTVRFEEGFPARLVPMTEDEVLHAKKDLIAVLNLVRRLDV